MFDPSLHRIRRTTVYPEQPLGGLRQLRAYLSLSLSNKIISSDSTLLSVLNWVDEHFDRCDIVIGDYLHRHNIATAKSVNESESLRVAMAEGQVLSKRIQALASQGQLPDRTIILTSTLRDDPSFTSRVESLEHWYSAEARFRGFIEDAVDAFMKRKHSSEPHDQAVRNHSVAYQLEELAMFEILLRDGYRVDVYPGSHLPIMKALVSGDVKGMDTVLRSQILTELKIY